MNLNFANKAVVAIAGTLAIAIPLLDAQPDPNLRFEVASVRRVEVPPTATGGVPAPSITGGVGTSDPGRITYRGTWLQPLIAIAFGVRDDQVIGLGAVSKERYDIIANIPPGATKEQFNVMLGNLLRDRFHLKFHMDSKVLPVYALRVAKNGPKFKETAPQADGAAVSSRPGGADAQGFPVLPPGRKGIVMLPHPGEMFMTAQDVPMADFARMIEQQAGRPVIDETGLTGHYDFKIHFEYIMGRGGAAAAASEPAPIIFTAVQEQLGLKLDSSTSSFPQLIVDSIDRDPTEN